MPTETPQDPTFRYDPELAPGYFVLAATVFLRAPSVTPFAKTLYLILCSYAGAGDTAWPGQQRLARECGCSERMIRKVLHDELIPMGLVEVEQQGLNRTNRYTLHKLPTLDRHTVPGRNGTPRRSKPAPPAHKVDSANLESGERIVPLIQGRKTPEEYNAEYERRVLG